MVGEQEGTDRVTGSGSDDQTPALRLAMKSDLMYVTCPTTLM